MIVHPSRGRRPEVGPEVEMEAAPAEEAAALELVTERGLA